MCVIIIKPNSAKMPTKSELKCAFLVNHDGCGFVSTSGKTFHSLDFEEFYGELKKVSPKEGCIIHFRLATHGSVKLANCHPFEKHGVFFAHNGILSIEPEGDKTDSQTAFENILLPVIESDGIESNAFKTAAKSIIGYSKFAFMKDGKIFKCGEYSCHQGRYYSNTRHLGLCVTQRPITWSDYLSMR